MHFILLLFLRKSTIYFSILLFKTHYLQITDSFINEIINLQVLKYLKFINILDIRKMNIILCLKYAPSSLQRNLLNVIKY